MVTFENKDDFTKIAFGNLEELSQADREEVKKMLPREKNLETVSEDNSRLGSGIHSKIVSDDSGIESNEKKKQKKKIIHKSQVVLGKSSVVSSGSKEMSTQPYLASLSIGQSIVEIGPEEIRVNTCKDTVQTFEYIVSKYKNLRGIHIFSHKLATKEWLSKIFKKYPHLVNISLNCRHQFDYSLLGYFTKESLGLIQTLELKWDLNNFFMDFSVLKYFPTKRKEYIEDLSKIHIPVKYLKDMSSNRSLAITSEKTIDYLL